MFYTIKQKQKSMHVVFVCVGIAVPSGVHVQHIQENIHFIGKKKHLKGNTLQ